MVQGIATSLRIYRRTCGLHGLQFGMKYGVKYGEFDDNSSR